MPTLEEPGDLEAFKPSPPAHRIDDKAATLEEELQEMKLRFGRERFMYIFIIATLFVLTLGPHLSGGMLAFLITAALVFTIAMGNYLDFPWAVAPLERWHDLWYRFCEQWLFGKKEERGTEPFENGDEEPK